MAEQLEKYENELGKLLQNPLMFDVEQSFRSTLAAQHTQIGFARKKLQQATGSGQLDPKQLGELSQQLAELAQTEDENVNQPCWRKQMRL